MAVVGYSRVSTSDQKQDRQLDQLKAYGCDVIREERVSGASPLTTRPVFNSMFAQLKSGDKLVVTSLDRLGRSLIDLLSNLSVFKEKGIELVVLNMGIDTSTPTGKMLFAITAAMAEVERDIISQRVREGQAASPNISGRPTVLTPQVLKGIKRGVDRGLHTAQIAKELHISTASVKRGYQMMSLSSVHKKAIGAGKKRSDGYCVDQNPAQ